MILNEVISQLQVLASQGHGELDVVVYEDENADYNVDNVKPQLIVGLRKKKNGITINGNAKFICLNI
jgi:hypothetical protein